MRRQAVDNRTIERPHPTEKRGRAFGRGASGTRPRHNDSIGIFLRTVERIGTNGVRQFKFAEAPTDAPALRIRFATDDQIHCDRAEYRGNYKWRKRTNA